MALLSFLLLSVLARHALGKAILARDEICFDTAYELVSTATFACDDAENYYAGACLCAPKVVSIYATAKKFCSDREFEAGGKLLKHTCHVEGHGLHVQPASFYAANLTAKVIAGYDILNMTAAAASAEDPRTKPYVPTEEFFQAYLKTVNVWNKEMSAHWHYGYAMYGFWGGIILIGILHKFFGTIRNRKVVSQKSTAHNGSQSSPGKATLFGKSWRIVKAQFVVAAGLGDYHQRLIAGCHIPTRAISTVLAAFWILNLVLCCVTYELYNGNLYFAEGRAQLRRYIADRTGILAYANLPLVWLFAGRNNILIWATGWEFATFNIFHRHVARIATLEAIAHSVAYTVDIFADSGAAGFYAYFKERFWVMGVVATVLMSVLLGLSTVWVRRWSYEIFLIIHVTFAIAVIVTLFYHTEIFTARDYDVFLWPLVAIWGFDRLLRLVRIAYCNFKVGFRQDAGIFTTAEFTYDKEADLIKLQVSPPSRIPVGPGQHYYVYQPTTWKGWENHPFSLAAWGEEPDVTGQDPVCSPTSITSQTKSPLRDSSVSSHDASVPPELPRTANTLEFWIRPFDGYTRRMRAKCLASPTHHHTAKIFLEGPYGHRQSLHAFHTVLLIAGGTGVTAVYPYMQEHMRRMTAGGAMATRSVRLLLAARQPAFVRRLADRELRAARGCADVEMEFYATGHDGHYTSGKGEVMKGSGGDVDGYGSSGSGDAVLHGDALRKEVDGTVVTLTKPEGGRIGGGAGKMSAPVEIRHRRPDIAEAVALLARENIEGGLGRERAAVMVCGPAGMADDARAAVKRALMRGADIEYFEESFAW